ncbi:3-dehydroquinate synthase [Paraglaciecola hydrolytica]|uniref:3-dehydroquinate synthase n=1 Tax=Paraglaciecola hydrolytica TaxID=1799789 RepID=A0A136A1T6_9ALTE|nr:3-dehydroquinate synthase [Paraglaciecola hydrolytica]KXI29191.1 3-dehydroquinate synthase [Paraglaciecola hydrolytica]
MTTLKVELGERSYPIFIQANLLQQPNFLAPFLKTKTVVVVTNEIVEPLYFPLLAEALKGCQISKIVINDGEEFKNLQTFELVISELLAMSAARDTTLIALGGGVVGDLTGFVAACFQRGMPFIQIPTTLLSQVDSSVGGKTAVNHPLGKNMIGAFYQPQAVLIDTNTLATLPEREFAAGMAEVIKYGVIYDAEFFEWLETKQEQIKAKDTDVLQYMIGRCCAIKAEIVAVDERESGLRALLNLGHTFGHAIEAEQGYGNWLHGEAVATGIVLASSVATKMDWLQTSEFRRIFELITSFNLPTSAPAEMNYDCFMRHMRHDKKVQAGKLNFVIPTSIGAAKVTSQISEEVLRTVLS